MGGIGVAWMHFYLDDPNWIPPVIGTHRRQMNVNTRYWQILWLLGPAVLFQELIQRLFDN